MRDGIEPLPATPALQLVPPQYSAYEGAGPLGLLGSVQQLFGHKREDLDKRDPRFARVVVGPIAQIP